MPLTDAAKPKDKPYKLFDSGGLSVLVHSNGSKYWRFKYRFEGKEKLLLKEAREAHSKARALLEEGLDPSTTHKNKEPLNTFQVVAEQWLESYLKRDVFPVIGSRTVADIKPKPPDIIPIIESIHKRVVRDTHLHTLQSIGQVLRYSIALGLRQDPDPTPSLKGLFPAKAPKKPFAAITDPLEVARLLRATEHYSSNFITKCALQFSSMVMMRPGAFIRAEWKNIRPLS
ncbi:integrase arm-type DNA-binding domain-containing protein [uncultured Thiothrix sp.]|mgnify:CR=1 FL=1|uniref:tyrosine-type recombinase/integrase n=1 Tax=uncultured Thiothrix sp. TaxID=223185 RepID=UPI00260B8C2E|nr:integrase arm-type DNA-binding domain-containing protein [uncultured Thiothrix sp.]HMT94789.1 integrase arm-type DNA-binding domain-containing protein [Thiolinea sp.]